MRFQVAHFDDLSPYAYDAAAAGRASAKNVGWLDAVHDFTKGAASAGLLEAIWEHCFILVTPTRGLHPCGLCDSSSNVFERGGTRLLLGSAEIRVFGAEGEVFAAPNLLYHYVAEHQYRPPPAFTQALASGPRPGSEEYKRALEGLGVAWRANVPLIEEPRQFRFVRTKDGVVREEVKGRR
jgi:hypothetical protein